MGREARLVGSELDIKIGRPGEPLRPLVPDLCFISFDRWSREQFETDAVPRVAPDVVVEILSPDDRRIDLEDKLDVYLQAVTTLALIVNPRERIVETYRAESYDRPIRCDGFFGRAFSLAAAIEERVYAESGEHQGLVRQ